jgi:hypothetical protein
MITRMPTHPVEVLLKDETKPLGLTVTEAVKNLAFTKDTC